MKTIVVIGLGNLGKRHLQSLTDLKDKYEIMGVDNNESIINSLQAGDTSGIKLYDSIEKLPKEIEVCVIATTSSVRYHVYLELVEHSNVKYILFEKVLFQNEEEYYKIHESLKKRNIKAWVNCVRREWDSYKSIKEEMKGLNKFVYTVTGGEWGLCCNGIHLIDLMLFLGGDHDFTFGESFIQKEIVESKRDGFYEMYGTLIGKSNKCEAFQISCQKNVDTPSLILIGSNIKNLMIDEAKNKVFLSGPEDGWLWHERIFQVPYQSELTAKIVMSMINGTCNLPSYDEAIKPHIKYINGLLQYFLQNGWKEKKRCPIT